VALGSFAALLFAVHLGWIPAPHEICERNANTHQNTCSSHDPAFVVVLEGFKILQQGSEAIIALGTLALAIFTFTLWRATDRLLTSAKEDGARMERSITEAAKAASAMEGVATAMENNAKNTETVVSQQRRFGEMQMRAYLSVLIGSATYQERERNWKFEARPLLKNTGNTTARKIKWRIGAAILPIPLPDDFKFPLPPALKGSSIMGAFQDGNMMGTVPDFVDDAAIAEIKRGTGRSLFVWGYVRYEDVFGKLHRNTFAQQLWWTPGTKKGQEIISGLHLGKHNRSN
jgi:hypothetical protein